MPRHDRGEIEMELLQSLESLRILVQIGEIKITELLFENTVPVKNFLLRENTKRALEDQDLVTYAAELALDETRLIREVTSSVMRHGFAKISRLGSELASFPLFCSNVSSNYSQLLAKPRVRGLLGKSRMPGHEIGKGFDLARWFHHADTAYLGGDLC
jgi:hypothetical protein